VRQDYRRADFVPVFAGWIVENSALRPFGIIVFAIASIFWLAWSLAV